MVMHSPCKGRNGFRVTEEAQKTFLMSDQFLNVAKLDEIYDLYFEDVFRFVSAFCNSIVAAEDITASVFLSVYNTFKYRPLPDDIKNMLLVTAKNEVADWLKRNESNWERISSIIDNNGK
jgi:DNA-directed RNA polymerase specialized sigma24 family protein